jgi:hypothetical protein
MVLAAVSVLYSQPPGTHRSVQRPCGGSDERAWFRANARGDVAPGFDGVNCESPPPRELDASLLAVAGRTTALVTALSAFVELPTERLVRGFRSPNRLEP